MVAVARWRWYEGSGSGGGGEPRDCNGLRVVMQDFLHAQESFGNLPALEADSIRMVVVGSLAWWDTQSLIKPYNP